MNNEQWETLRFFSSDEFSNPENMDYLFLLRLNMARLLSGVPYVITSDYRERDNGSHGKGLAADIRCRDSRTRSKMVEGLIFAGFKRIGIYDLHIHVDIDESRPSPVMWLGKSR